MTNALKENAAATEMNLDELDGVAGGYPSLHHEDTHASSNGTGNTTGGSSTPAPSPAPTGGGGGGGYPPGMVVVNPWLNPIKPF